MRVHIVMHESYEAPAAIESWAKNKGYEISYTRIYQAEAYPEQVNGFDFLVIMGGPQSPATTLLEDPHFDSQKEITFIKKAIEADKYLVGVCLGAQMIGEALGAKFEHSPHREIGKFPITLTKDGKKDPHFSSFPQTLAVGHWHSDMPGLTPNSKIIAVSKGCPRQIVHFAPKIYGFQCHLEFTPETIEALIKNSTKELTMYKDLAYVQTAEVLRKNEYSEMHTFLYTFLDSFTRS